MGSCSIDEVMGAVFAVWIMLVASAFFAAMLWDTMRKRP